MTETTEENTAPKGYMTNAAGHLVPCELVSDIDKARNDLVHDIVYKATELRQKLAQFKEQTFGDLGAFVDLSAEKYGVALGGIKGNLTLTSFDGRYRIMLNQADIKVFDERLHVAKKLIDGCIHKWTAGSRVEIRALVEHAFQADKKGSVNMARIYTLLQLQIEDGEWQQAMDALRDSMQVVGTKAYLRIMQRNKDGEYVHFPLDLAAL